MASDETVVKTRLLLDGDGTGDDRRLNLLTKSLLKWIASKPSDAEDPEKPKMENMKEYAKLVSTLVQCEWIDGKSKLVQEMNAREAENYEKVFANIKDEIAKAERDIKETKEELVRARRIRRNRLEYDAMAKVINQNEDRATTSQKIDDVKAELERLKATEASLEEKLEERKKQFHVLVQSIHNLQALLDEDNMRFDTNLKTSTSTPNDGGGTPDLDDADMIVMDSS